MGITTSSSRSGQSAINVTPLIDVLLVLLIIFMVIQPTVQHGLDALAPQPSETRDTQPDPRVLVISVDGAPESPTYAINGQAIASAELGPELYQIARQRGPQALFIRGAAGLDYASVVPVIALSHAAGFDGVGILTPATLSQ